MFSHWLLMAGIAVAMAAIGCSGPSGGGGGGGAGSADAGKALFTSKGCIACHTLAAVPGAVGTVGPKLDGIGTAAATRKAGMSAEAYLRESITDPQAFIAPGFTAPSPMPTGLATGKEVDDLIAFLLTQK
jgi:cytochrome c oxidase subunit 2